MLRWLRHPRLLLLWRYSASSVIAGVISELAFLAAYGAGSAPLVASVVAFVAGAVPNYVLNRRWAWQRTGRADRTRELLPYIVIVVITFAIAALVTTAAHGWLQEQISSHALQTLLVGAAYLGTYGVMFVLKFLLFDRFVFAGSSGRARATRSRP